MFYCSHLWNTITDHVVGVPWRILSELLWTRILTLPSRLVTASHIPSLGVATTLSPASIPWTEQSARASARGLTEPKFILQLAKINLPTPTILLAVIDWSAILALSLLHLLSGSKKWPFVLPQVKDGKLKWPSQLDSLLSWWHKSTWQLVVEILSWIYINQVWFRFLLLKTPVKS